MKNASFQTNFKPLSGTTKNAYFISLSLQFHADSTPVKVTLFGFLRFRTNVKEAERPGCLIELLQWGLEPCNLNGAN